MIKNNIFLNLITVATVLAGANSTAIAVTCSDSIVNGATCCTSGSGNPYVCLDKSGSDPEEGADFFIDETDPARLDVSLVTGNSAWVIWSQVSNSDTSAAAIGDILIDSTAASTADFSVEIMNPDEDVPYGATSIESINLSKSEWTGGSSVATGSEISSKLNGNLIVAESSSAEYGEIDMVIAQGADGKVVADTIKLLDIGNSLTGDVIADVITSLDVGTDLHGDVTATEVTHLEITEDYEGSMDLGKIVIDGEVIIGGHVIGTSEISIDDMAARSLFELKKDLPVGAVVTFDVVSAFNNNPAEIKSGTFYVGCAGPAQLKGDIVFKDGVPRNTDVLIRSRGSRGATIDLNHEGVSLLASLSCEGGRDFDIINGGTVIGDVLLGSCDDFEGTATFSSVSSGATVKVDSQDLEGTITVTGDMDGAIDVIHPAPTSAGGNCVDGSEISIGGTLRGDITIEHELAGDIDLEGAVSSTSLIDIGDSLASTGRILCDGLFDGVIEVGRDNAALSQIVLTGGIDDDGSVVINTHRGDYDANGAIHVGYTSLESPPQDVTFDGGISVYDNGSGQYGDLDGTIKVVGCHTDDLEICIEGSSNGHVRLEQAGCTNQVSFCCSPPCAQ